MTRLRRLLTPFSGERLLSLLHLPRVWACRLLWALITVYFVAGAGLLALRWAVLPNVPAYREDVAALLSRSLGRPVAIGALSAQWHGFRPALRLDNLTLLDERGEPALTLAQVNTELGWTSLPLLKLRLHRLEVVAPHLELRRDADGSLFVAGLQVNAEGESGDFLPWLLDQREVVVRDARVDWEDARRGAPALELRQVNLRLENRGSQHRFGLQAVPPSTLAATLDVRGDLRGRDPQQPASWRGEVFIGLDYADLGAWKTWVDYPLDLAGAGGVRAWLEFGEARVKGITADFALRDARARLAPELEAIDAMHAEGRLRYADDAGRVEASGKRLALETRDGLKVAPTDFFLRWQPGRAGTPARGEFVANQLDLGVLAELAERLPVEPGFRRRLADLAPSGSVAPLNLKWTGEAGALATYSVDAKFAGLGIRPGGAWPGFAGLSGRIEGNDRGGRFSLSGRQAALDLPQVFPESRLALEEMAADGTWSHPDGMLEVNLGSVSFANRDTRGTASGRYRARPDTPGEIDLQARLAEAESTAVWRYMPGVVNQRARDWLQHSLTGGRARDARLVLRGNLAKFPFRDPKDGVFRVTAKVSDGSLDYAPGWPKIEDVTGELVFEAAGMSIKAQHGRIFGVELKDVSVVLPDFETHEVLSIDGKASGPTQDFLRFIAESPVGARINHFTDGFRTEGVGTLDLHLALPLHRMETSRVKGEFQFARNKVQPDPVLPVLTDAAGRIGFTENQLVVRSGTALLYGEPASVSGGTRPDGTVLLAIQGNASIAALRRELDEPLLDHLSGATAWKGTIAVPRQGGLEVHVDSGLQGIASSLPEPFNKSPAAAMPLRADYLAGGSTAGDSFRLAIGPSFQMQTARRREGGRWSPLRGGMALDEPLRMADKGVLLAATADRLDVDAWRRALSGGGAGNGGSGAGGGLPISGVALKAGELRMFGQRLNDVNLRAVMEEGGWQARLASREATGELTWRDQGRGRLQARFRQLAISGGTSGSGSEAGRSADRLSELPGLDVTADSFVLRGRALGKLDLKAANRGDTWRLEHLSLASPDGTLSGDGSWRPGAKEETRLNFKLDVGSIEKMLARLGYPEAVRQGKAQLDGEIGWRGPPTALHLASLNGHMNVRSEGGQFSQLEPGVGRLLGVLSLQALPRRITLDFRDVFSQGFAFDRISGSIQMNDGVLRTEDLELVGPAARVFMSGDADAVRETQSLRVKVQPTLSESVAVGSALATTGVIHPAVGLAAYLVQKALRDPVEKLFSFEYAVTGSWSDPKVEKIAAVRLPAAPANPAERIGQ